MAEITLKTCRTGAVVDILSRQRRYSLKPLVIVANQAVSSLANFAIAACLVRVLGVSGFGTYSIYYVISLSVSSIVTAFVSSPLLSIAGGKSPDRREAMIGSYFTIIAVIAAVIVVLALIFLASAEVGKLLSYEAPLFVLALLISQMSTDTMRRILIFRHQINLLWMIDLGRYAIILLGIVAGLFFHVGYLQYYILLIFFSGILAVLIPLLFARWVFGTYRASSFREDFREISGMGTWLSLSTFMQLILDYAPVLISGAILGPFETGLLRSCQTLVGVINPVFQALENIIPKRLGERIARVGPLASISEYFGLAVSTFAVLAIPLCLLAVLSGPVLYIVFGPETEGADWILRGYCVLYSVNLAGVLVTFAYRALQHTLPVFLALVAGAAVSLCACVPAMQHWGAIGVVATLLLSHICVVTLQFVVLMRRRLAYAAMMQARGADD